MSVVLDKALEPGAMGRFGLKAIYNLQLINKPFLRYLIIQFFQMFYVMELNKFKIESRMQKIFIIYCILEGKLKKVTS